MKKIFYKIGCSFIIGFTTMVFAIQPAKAQDLSFEGWQIYDAYTRMNSRVHFESWIFNLQTVREEFGFSYLIGYMNGVNGHDIFSNYYRDKINNAKWYQKGYRDGFLDRFLHQSRQCITLNLFFAEYFSFYSYMLPYRAVRGWLQVLSRPNFYPAMACLIGNRTPRYYVYNYGNRNEVIYVNDPTTTARPTRSPTDYRNNGEHKNISSNRSSRTPEYTPTDKPTRSITNYRNNAEHTRNRSRKRGVRNDEEVKKDVLQQTFQQWPELRQFVERTGLTNINIVTTPGRYRRTIDLKKMTIEIAIPGRQFDRETNRYIADRLDIDLPEFDYRPVRSSSGHRSSDNNARRSRNVSSRNRSRNVSSRSTVSSNTESSSRTKSRTNTRSSSRNNSRGGDN